MKNNNLTFIIELVAAIMLAFILNTATMFVILTVVSTFMAVAIPVVVVFKLSLGVAFFVWSAILIVLGFYEFYNICKLIVDLSTTKNNDQKESTVVVEIVEEVI